MMNDGKESPDGNPFAGDWKSVSLVVLLKDHEFQKDYSGMILYLQKPYLPITAFSFLPIMTTAARPECSENVR
jgi:hypothetical protein